MAEVLRVTSRVGRLSEVLSEGTLSVPWHQRYYDWEEEHVDDLLYDLRDAHEFGKGGYFLGAIMLVGETEESGKRDINDGQQRLITFSILLALLVRSFARKRPRDRGREAKGVRYLFQVTQDETLSVSDASRRGLRIDPPRNDEARFRQILSGEDVGTDGKLTSAWNTIRRFVDALGVKAAADFFDFLLQRVDVAILDVPASMDASSIFEALNGRGKNLSDLDRMRNRLYSYFADDRCSERREGVHESLENTLEILGGGRRARGGGRAEEYFRCFFQCEYGFINKSRFYKEAKRHLPDRTDSGAAGKQVSKLVQRMTWARCVELFRTITSSSVNENLLKEFRRVGRQRKRGLGDFLRELRGYKVSHPLLFSLMRRFVLEQDAELKREMVAWILRSIRNLDAFVMRTAFCASKFEPSKFEALFANHARRISASSGLYDLDIYSFLSENDVHGVISDDAFVARMQDVTLTDRGKAKRYLLGINAMREKGKDPLQGIPESRFVVERVLPQSKEHCDSSWTSFSDVEVSEWAHRAGNMVLLLGNENDADDEGNSSFEVKREILGKSALQISRDAACFSEWTPAVVQRRSRHLAKEAAQAWSFDTSARERART